MNIKFLMIIAISPIVFFSQVSQAGNTSTKTETLYDFKYTDSNCKKHGFDGGAAKFNNLEVCTRKQDVKLLKQRPKNNKTWKKTTSTTDYHECRKNNTSCTTSLSKGANDCISSSSSSAHNLTVSVNLARGIGIQLLSGGGSISYGHTWTKTKGTSKCVTKNLNLTCTIGPKKQVRLKHIVTMQRFTTDAQIKGWQLSRVRTTTTFNRNRPGGKRKPEVKYSSFKAYRSTKKFFKSAVDVTLPVKRSSVCDAKKLK